MSVTGYRKFSRTRAGGIELPGPRDGRRPFPSKRHRDRTGPIRRRRASPLPFYERNLRLSVKTNPASARSKAPTPDWPSRAAGYAAKRLPACGWPHRRMPEGIFIDRLPDPPRDEALRDYVPVALQTLILAGRAEAANAGALRRPAWTATRKMAKPPDPGTDPDRPAREEKPCGRMATLTTACAIFRSFPCA